MNYQKVYMNHVFSSTTMSYLTHMWKSQLLCDAVIKTGTVVTKAHRLVLIAACPMLQNMDNASLGSHLEVRLASDISQESVVTFLQYLYEGYMTLNEDVCRDVEKIAKLMQVDSIMKCCSDFYRSLSAKTGVDHVSPSLNFRESADFHHVRATDIQKTVSDVSSKRSSDELSRESFGTKRQRQHEGSLKPSTKRHAQETDDRNSMSQIYRSRSETEVDHDDPDVIEIAGDTLEVIMSDPAERDSDGWPMESSLPSIQRSQGIAVASKQQREIDLRIVNVVGRVDMVQDSVKISTPKSVSNENNSCSLPTNSLRFSPVSHGSASPILQQNPAKHSVSIPPPSDSQIMATTPKMPPLQPKPSLSVQSKSFAAGKGNQLSPAILSSNPLTSSSLSQNQSQKEKNLPFDLDPHVTSSPQPSPSSTQDERQHGRNVEDLLAGSGSADISLADLSIVKVESADIDEIIIPDNPAPDKISQSRGRGQEERGGVSENSNSMGDISLAWGDQEHSLQGNMGSHVTVPSLQFPTCQNSDQTPYVCAICGFTSLYKPNMRRHIKNHSPDRPHQCQLCKKGFKRKDYLKLHMTIVHGDE